MRKLGDACLTEKQTHTSKKLNLTVITDGSADDEPEVESYITEVARELDRLGAKGSQIGIHFVQVGEEPNASEFLRRLDDDLKHNTKPPIRDVSTMITKACEQYSGMLTHDCADSRHDTL